MDLAESIVEALRYGVGKLPSRATKHDWYMAFAHVVRERMLERWIATLETLQRRDVRGVAYLSAEFLMGPHLGNNLLNLGLLEEGRRAASSLGLDFDEILAQEEEPGLGNGGLGRLAACFLDSLATVQIPAVGYGIRYEFGIFDQVIRDGAQVEVTDKWLRYGNPWEICRPEIAHEVGFGGRTENWTDERGRFRVRWVPARVVIGVAHDTPVLGYRVGNANLLRLWKAEACESFDFQAFNTGDYWGAVDDKVVSENISKVLYPNDEPAQGKQLRLEQQYFFTCCALKDMVTMHRSTGAPLEAFHETWAVQLNDTHPSVAVAELMRLLVDEHGIDWDPAWEITRAALAYTNHTLLPEALETWPVELFGALLPRHLEIVYEINRRFLDEVRARFPGDEGRVSRMSIVEESRGRRVRMAHLATVGTHAVNGVAALHSDLLKRETLADFHAMWPERFHNVTNGVTPRRWVALSNPGLAALITGRIGDRWLVHPEEELPAIESYASDAAFRRAWREVKLANKRTLAEELALRAGVPVDPESMFDVQVKRFHEYKRQHLNVLNIVATYLRLLDDPGGNVVPRVWIFGGKAAPGYAAAKEIIRLIHAVGAVVNGDPRVGGRLKVAFFPDFNVTNGQKIYPAADLSEQISTAGKEASGTGNMKFAMNGAITIGTLDGANVEIREAVGEENFALFGLTAEEVAAWAARGYHPREVVEREPFLARVLETVGSLGFRPFVEGLVANDPFFVLADFAAYAACQDRVSETWRDTERWTRMSIFNACRVGRFSSDRSIRDYAERIWKVSPMPVEVP
ncbi:MAG TPA: glycogen/starch/alpha-glucan phosphorylase [Candidatus Polarisedimenticolaceae bacterium]